MNEHVSVMVDEVLEALRPWENVELVIDATLGLGGHSGHILRSCDNAKLIGFDQDPQAREIAEKNLSNYGERVEIVADNFRNIDSLLDRDGWQGASAVLFDLGVSNLQLTKSERGFSFNEDGLLDMRMDEGDVCNSKSTAAEIINEWSVNELTRIFREYGEDANAYRIAKGIVRHRETSGEIRTTFELVGLIREILPAPVQRKMGGHPARKIFQALRIAVNDEMSALEEALDGAIKVLSDCGKIIVISYHSLEDRIVKHRFKRWQDDFMGRMEPRKALLPTDEEIERNYKSRSAKLRVFLKKKEEGGLQNALQRMPT